MTALWVALAVVATWIVAKWDERHGLTWAGRWEQWTHALGIHHPHPERRWECRTCGAELFTADAWMARRARTQYLFYGTAEQAGRHMFSQVFMTGIVHEADEIATGCWSIKPAPPDSAASLTR